MTDNIYLGKDIALIDGDILFNVNQDFQTVNSTNNLKQAVFHRIATFKGEFYNRNYGSEVYKCIGEHWSDELQTRLTGFIYEALNQEPRVKEVSNIEFKYNTATHEITVYLTVVPINSIEPLNLIFPLFI